MKRIVICADGTWNLRDQIDDASGRRRPTNVTKVARAIKPRTAGGIDQVVFYDNGIGTEGPLDKVSGGAFGRGMEENIRELYRFIAYNYEPGDEIFLFGFSRGAFTVRSLVGFMNKLGLLEKDDDYYVPEFYACYELSKGPGSPEWDKAFHNVKGTRPCPPILFIGVWDTVGALGAPGALGQIFNKNKYKYHDVSLTPHVLNAYHALAIDERRRPFMPSLWSKRLGWQGHLEQVWFCGVHCNVGGGYAPDGLANEALQWMAEKAEGHGLELNDSYLKYFRPCFNSTLHDSMSAKYRVMGAYERPIGSDPSQNETIHQSVIDRRTHFAEYRPPNLEARLSGSTSTEVYTQTQRISRGTPC